MFEFLALGLICLAVPVIGLLLFERFEPISTDRGRRAADIFGKTSYPLLDDILARLRPWHLFGVCVFSVLIFSAMMAHNPEIPFFLAVAFVVLLFARAWRHEFVTLMSRSDDSFPGRLDKPIWVAVMVLLPPIGYICFRAFCRAERLVAEPVSQANAKPVATPSPEWF